MGKAYLVDPEYAQANDDMIFLVSNLLKAWACTQTSALLFPPTLRQTYVC